MTRVAPVEADRRPSDTAEAGELDVCRVGCRWLVQLLRAGRTRNGATYPLAVLYRIAEVVVSRPIRAVRIGQELAHPRASDPVPAGVIYGAVTEAWVDEARQALLGIVHLEHGPNRLRAALTLMERRGLVRTCAVSLAPRDVTLGPDLVVADVGAIEAVDVVTHPASDAHFIRSLVPGDLIRGKERA